jgi:hypothetical protein
VTEPQSQCDRILETLALGKGGHDWSTAPDQSDRDRFMAKVRVDENGCWRWTAGHNRKGYGCFGMKRQNMGAHRAAYMLFVGPIPEGLTIDHLCRVRDCVNPAHLEAVPHVVNVRRGTTGMYPHGHRTHCNHGHEFDDENTGWRSDGGGRFCRACRREAMRRYQARNREALRERNRIAKREEADRLGKPSRWPGRVHPMYQGKEAAYRLVQKDAA